MVHVKWNIHAERATNVNDIKEAFSLAYNLLLLQATTDEVTVWLSGDRNVPTKLTADNLETLRKQWLEGVTNDKEDDV